MSTEKQPKNYIKCDWVKPPFWNCHKYDDNPIIKDDIQDIKENKIDVKTEKHNKKIMRAHQIQNIKNDINNGNDCFQNKIELNQLQMAQRSKRRNKK